MATSWTRALVTGASSGIGDAFSRELASDGVNLVVVARSRDALETLAEELRHEHGVEVEVLVADLTEEADLDEVAQRLGDRTNPIDLLVNNAGFGASGRFHELDADLQDRMVRLNMTALTVLSHAAIPTMRERGRGGILNIASMVALLPVPTSAVYAATKAYVLSFSEALHEELRRDGISVTCLNPGYTRTEFQDVGEYDTSQIPNAMWMDARPVARDGLDAVARGRAVATPGTNAPMAAMMRLSPSAVLRKGAGAFATGMRPPIPTRLPKATRDRALITGASRGLGAEFARQLAEGGSNLVLTARTARDLEALAAQLTTDHGVDVEVLVADLAEPEGVAAVQKRLEDQDRPIDLFVNNAGFGQAGRFANTDIADQVKVIDVNVRAATALAHAATRTMVGRGNGSIINVASTASFAPAPGMAVYAGGKAYLRFLTEASHEELHGTGVRLLALCPGYTRTSIFEAGGGNEDDVPSFLMGEADNVIRTALRRLDQPGATTVPVWYDRIIATSGSHLPRALVRKVATKIALG